MRKKNNENAKQIREKKIVLIKTAAMLIFIIIVFVLYTVAWFTYNNDDFANGFKMADNGLEYQVSFLENGKDGIYTEEYRNMIGDPSALVWQMTAENNMDNLEEDGDGIYPGAYGVISFYLTPKVENLDLDFSFEILGFTKGKDDETSGTADSMIALDSSTVPAKFLNGHILLFGARAESVNNGEKSYIYSKPILSDKDMRRVLKESYKNQKDKAQLVNIYWVWPQTLSTLVDARNCQTVTITEKPFTDNDDYNKIVNNILAFPSYYFEYGDNSESDSITENDIVTNYSDYGGYYDLADNKIGSNIDYLLLKLTVSKSDTSGSD